MEELEGRVAVVTGAASGIGRATAAALAAEGMRVVLADIETGPLAAAVAELSAAGHDVVGVPTDVSSWDDVRRLADAAIDRFGAVHVVHNNAGVMTAGPIVSLSLEDWAWVLGVNLWSVVHGVKAFLPLLRDAGEGHVVNTASSAGLQAMPYLGPYNASKFGVVAVSETLAHELAAEASPIGVSVLCPGGVDTRIMESDRNRPPEVTAGHESSPEEAAFTSRAAATLAAGMAPSDVASQVVDAICTQRFWVITHPGWVEVVQRRAAALAADGSLYFGTGG